jgi:hypothetical protein
MTNVSGELPRLADGEAGIQGVDERSTPDTELDADRRCGVIMPISATASHSSKHWRDVQSLLHRAVRKAGFDPVNAWQNEVNDRVSESIIANIFSFPLVVADITDLNPNVMFELGLRLASKLPTVVVVNQGGVVPFDISDFRYEPYPADLNILEMEEFINNLAEALRKKSEALASGTHKPFLSNVVIETVKPREESITVDAFIKKELASISNRLARIEKGSTSSASKLFGLSSSVSAREGGVSLYARVPSSKGDDVLQVLMSENIYQPLEVVSDDEMRLRIPDNLSVSGERQLIQKLTNLGLLLQMESDGSQGGAEVKVRW